MRVCDICEVTYPNLGAYEHANIMSCVNKVKVERDEARRVARMFVTCMLNGNRPEWSKCVELWPWLESKEATQ